MHIINPQYTKELFFLCGRLIHDYLVEEGVDPVGSDEKGYYFSKTEKLESKLKESPFYIKIYMWLEKNEWRKEG